MPSVTDSPSADDVALFGRDEQTTRLRSLLDSAVAGRGTSILLQGDAGIGKTALVTEARAQAAALGCRVLLCRGVRAGGGAGFAALHEVLHPVLDRIEALPRRQADSLRVAFGEIDGDAPDRLVTSLATLGLLEEAASEAPLLIIVEDLHWIDASSADALAFVAARLSNARALMVATTRVDRVYPDREADFAEHILLSPLDLAQASALLAHRGPELTPQLRDRILADASGNPLALTEFASEAASIDRAGGWSRLPITRRIERAFLAEVALLPERSQRALLVAASGEDARYDEVLAAARLLGLDEGDFVVAERINLVRVVDGAYRFRHPLVGAALYDTTDSAELSTVHRALAASTADAARAARHRAAAALGWDEEAAAGLDAVAEQAERRGARTEATAAWRRAAELSPAGDDRGRRLALAAESARQAGDPAEAAALVAQALPIAHAEDSVLRLARTDWMLSQTTAFQGRSARDLVELAMTLSDLDDRIEILVFAAVRAYILQETAAVKGLVADALRAVPSRDADVFRRIGLTLVDPARGFDGIEQALAHFEGRMRPTDAVLLNCLAFCAEEVNDLAGAEIVWDAATRAFHAAARTSDEATGLCGRGGLRLTAGEVTTGLADVEQALRLSIDLGLGVVGGMAAAQIAHGRAIRGERDEALAAIEVVYEQAGREPFARIAATASWASGLVALGDRRYDDAIAELQKTSVNDPIALWAGGDLAEPAVRAGRPDVVRAWLERADEEARATRSDHLTLLVERSRALLAEGADARRHFEAAIVAGERADARLDLARARLFFGEWLRRERRIVEARAQLWSALRVFEAASVPGLAERASAELRAAGGAEPSRGDDTIVDAARLLTAQELLVAQLAARGLTNKEIADQIYLSHRTVGAHLHRAFAKLGISRRSQLAAVVAG